MYCGKVASALYKKELLWIDDFAEVLQFVRWGRNNRISSRLPSCRTDFSMLVSVLESLNQSQGLIHRSAHWHVIHGDLAEVAFVINDKQTPQCVAEVF